MYVVREAEGAEGEKGKLERCGRGGVGAPTGRGALGGRARKESERARH